MSNESRLDTARSMLLAAPPGQLESLLQDFEAMFAATGEKFEPSWVEQVRADYANSTRTTSVDAPTTPKAKELYESIKAYQSEYYSAKGVVSALVVTEEEGDNVVVRTYAERIDEANCQAGSWACEWTVLLASNEVKGTVKIRAFLHEEGSVQLHSTRELGPSSCSKNAVTQIGDWEQEACDSIAQLYDTMGDKLKSLRRGMPVTRTKMEWNVLSHRMVKLLDDTKQE